MPLMASIHLVHELMTVAQDDVEDGRVKLIAGSNPS
jgi:hypothetical protein